MLPTCVYPRAKDEKLEVDKLGAIVDSMNRLRVNEETPVSEDTETVLQTAIDALMQRIKDMGGTSAIKKAEEKLKARRAYPGMIEGFKQLFGWGN